MCTTQHIIKCTRSHMHAHLLPLSPSLPPSLPPSLSPGFGRMDEQAAMFILKKVITHFISIVTEQAKTLPDDNGMCMWERLIKLQVMQPQWMHYVTLYSSVWDIHSGISQYGIVLCCGLDVGGRVARGAGSAFSIECHWLSILLIILLYWVQRQNRNLLLSIVCSSLL